MADTGTFEVGAFLASFNASGMYGSAIRPTLWKLIFEEYATILR